MGAGGPPAPGIYSEQTPTYMQAEGRSEHTALQGGVANTSLFPCPHQVLESAPAALIWSSYSCSLIWPFSRFFFPKATKILSELWLRPHIMIYSMWLWIQTSPYSFFSSRACPIHLAAYRASLNKAVGQSSPASYSTERGWELPALPLKWLWVSTLRNTSSALGLFFCTSSLSLAWKAQTLWESLLPEEQNLAQQLDIREALVDQKNWTSSPYSFHKDTWLVSF